MGDLTEYNLNLKFDAVGGEKVHVILRCVQRESHRVVTVKLLQITVPPPTNKTQIRLNMLKPQGMQSIFCTLCCNVITSRYCKANFLKLTFFLSISCDHITNKGLTVLLSLALVQLHLDYFEHFQSPHFRNVNKYKVFFINENTIISIYLKQIIYNHHLILTAQSRNTHSILLGGYPRFLKMKLYH